MKVIVPYNHDTADLTTIELGFGKNEPKEWYPALRDVINDRRVVWVRSDSNDPVWVRDREGVRQARTTKRSSS